MEARHLVATVLVEPSLVADLELRVMTDDLWLWPVRTAPVVVDGERMEFQLRRRLVEQRRGAWDDAAAWTPVWIGFGDAWHEFGPDGSARPTGPLPWAAHQRLWHALGGVRLRSCATGGGSAGSPPSRPGTGPGSTSADAAPTQSPDGSRDDQSSGRSRAAHTARDSDSETG